MGKICIICPYAYPLLANRTDLVSDGGAEAQLTSLGSEFAYKGYEVHFIVDDYGQAGREVIRNIITHKVELKYKGGSNCYLPLAWIKLWWTLYQINADIHLIKLPRELLFPIGIFCALMKKALVFIAQIDADVNPDFIKKNENAFSYWFFRIGLFCVDYVIAQNKKQRIGFLKSYNKKAKIIKSIITLPKYNSVNKKKYILWVGNNLPKKQPEKFLELAKAFPEYQFKMIMSLQKSDDDDSFVTDQLSLISNLEYLGYVPFSQIADHFQSAGIFVSTSLREGFPNTFLQSWQYGTPVVSLHVDPDNIIDNYKIGRHSRTFERLCEDIRELMENDTLREQMGRNAKNYVYCNHAADIIVPQYLDLFRK